MKKLRIVLIGDCYVGKTGIVNILRQRESDIYRSTIFEHISHYLEYDSRKYELTILDTSGKDDYVKLRHTAYQKIDLVILCFAVNNNLSYQHIESKWIPELEQNQVKCPKLILGLKADLRYQQNVNDFQYIISHREGKDLADKFNLNYLEFGKYSEDISETKFENIIKILKNGIDIIKIANLHTNKKKQKCLIM